MILPLPELPSFDYVLPQSYEQALDMLQEHPTDARLFMGGTDVFVQMRDRTLAPKFLIDVKHLPGMTSIEFIKNVGFRLGAAVNMNMLARHPEIKEHLPLLAEAANSVASYQVRNRATLGGNLCNASPAADTAPTALVLEVILVAISLNGERMIPISEFFLGPSETALERGELLKRIDIPIPPEGTKGRYLKLGRNAEGDLAIAGVAVLGFPDDTIDSGYRFRIALASVAPIPLRVLEAEEILSRGSITDQKIEAAANAVQDACQPIDDVRASGKYRKAMVGVLTRRGLYEVWSALKEGG
jgi:CO/xanthine dehydrogenase FAD-binding subunit